MNNSDTHYTNLVKEAIFCFEQSTPEKYEEDVHKAIRYESCIFELFHEMTTEELISYKARLIELGYAKLTDYPIQTRAEITEWFERNK